MIDIDFLALILIACSLGLAVIVARLCLIRDSRTTIAGATLFLLVSSLMAYGATAAAFHEHARIGQV